MSIKAETGPDAVQCLECGHRGDASTMIIALDGVGRRCADQDSCHDRKEERSGFIVA